LERSKAWGEIAYRPLTAPWGPALELFRFAGAWAPSSEHVESGWGAWDGERLCGALLAERAGSWAMLNGPVVVAPPDAPPEAGLEVAAELLLAALRHADAEGIDTVLTRPQGLDRIWVRHGFIPVPAAELPKALRGRPGLGLFGWRGGTALWSAAGRGVPRRARADAGR
jgi:hypothetical protein